MKALTPLRGLACLAVLIFHSGVPFRGYLGVDLFFVLSGFVLMHAYGRMETTKASYFGFLKNRLARIYPVHILILAMVLPLFQTRPDFSAGGLASSLLLLQSPWHSATWNYGAWSISAEWHAYLVFPFLATVLNQKSRKVLIVILAGCAVMLFATMYFKTTANMTNTPAVFLRLFPEFIAGMCLYRLKVEVLRISGDAWALASAAGIVTAQILGLSDAVTICLLPCLLLGAIDDKAHWHRFLNLKPIAYLGEISYSVYMVGFLLAVAEIYIFPPMNPILTGIVGAAGTLALGALVSRFVEYPARDWLKKIRLDKPSQPAVQPGGAPAAARLTDEALAGQLRFASQSPIRSIAVLIASRLAA